MPDQLRVWILHGARQYNCPEAGVCPEWPHKLAKGELPQRRRHEHLVSRATRPRAVRLVAIAGLRIRDGLILW